MRKTENTYCRQDTFWREMQGKSDLKPRVLSACPVWGAFSGDPFGHLFGTCPFKSERKKRQKLCETTGFEHISNLGCFLGGPLWHFSGEGKKQPLGAEALKTLGL